MIHNDILHIKAACWSEPIRPLQEMLPTNLLRHHMMGGAMAGKNYPYKAQRAES
jgi:hypothetical protein